MAMDDFGAGCHPSAPEGFSGATLKIDRFFIRDLDDAQERCPISDAILAMGKRVGLRVVGKEIENRLQSSSIEGTGVPLRPRILAGTSMPNATRHGHLHKASV